MPRKKLNKIGDEPFHIPAFDAPLNSTNCTPDVCNFKPSNKHIWSAEINSSRVRGHLRVVHGFDNEQTFANDTKANRFYRQALGLE